MEPELIMALVGIAIAVVGLAALSILQTTRMKREKDAKVQAVRAVTTGADVPPGATRFFVARYTGNNARFFRVYVDDGALLFLNAGPYFVTLGADIVRGTDRRHWTLQAAKLLVTGLATGAVAAAVAFFAIGRGVARNAGGNPAAGGTILYGTLGLIALLTVGFIVALPFVVRRVTRRAAELDALTLAGLREQAEIEERSFRATPDNVSDVKLDYLELNYSFARGNAVGATVTFRHTKTGKWKLETTSTRDTLDALAAFRGLVGPDAVTLEPFLKSQLPKPKKAAVDEDKVQFREVGRRPARDR